MKLLLILLGVMFFSSLLNSNVYAVFYPEDFQITNFGLKNGHPFVEVQGQAGLSFSVGGGDETYYAYTFVTDKGIFSSTVSLGSSDTKPYYSTAHIEVSAFKEGTCINEKISSGSPLFSGKLAEYIPKTVVFNEVSKAYTYKVTADDPDNECPSGQHIEKIFSSK
ncbi:MAG: hypothetical protein H0X03_02260 [Nitrosopumilus sp.]|nr:hypothetical protein [Nitrosopumilus sp.]